MKSDYSIRLETLTSEVLVAHFYCTRRQIDNVFYALAFASPGSDLESGTLYLHHSPHSGVDVNCLCEQLNHFEVTHV